MLDGDDTNWHVVTIVGDYITTDTVFDGFTIENGLADEDTEVDASGGGLLIGDESNDGEAEPTKDRKIDSRPRRPPSHLEA
jgi:hypothetical protein